VKVLHRYLIREMALYFSAVLLLVLILFVAIDYLGRMDHFIESGISLFRALAFVLLKAPFMAVLFIPVGTLLSVLVVFGIMAKKNELVALRGGGVSIYQLFRPVFMAEKRDCILRISAAAESIFISRARFFRRSLWSA
jgi:lipopolysaccharide export system permease protein